MEERKIVVTFVHSQTYRFELDADNNDYIRIKEDGNHVWLNDNDTMSLARRMLKSHEARRIINEDIGKFSVSEHSAIDHKQFLDNLNDAIMEMVENDPEELKRALEEKGYDYDKLVREGVEFVKALQSVKSK